MTKKEKEKLQNEFNDALLNKDKFVVPSMTEPKLNNRWIAEISGSNIESYQIQAIQFSDLLKTKNIFTKNRIYLELLHIVDKDLITELSILSKNKSDIKVELLDPTGVAMSTLIFKGCRSINNTLRRLAYSENNLLISDVVFKFDSLIIK